MKITVSEAHRLIDKLHKAGAEVSSFIVPTASLDGDLLPYIFIIPLHTYADSRMITKCVNVAEEFFMDYELRARVIVDPNNMIATPYMEMVFK